MSVSFTLEKIVDANGIEVPTLVKTLDGVRDEWCTVTELDRLFDTCFARWQHNWNLDKLCTVVRESEID